NNTVSARQRLAGSGVQFFDVHYADLVADPLAMAENILRFAGLEPTESGRAAMQQWLRENAQNKHGGHRYQPAEFGIRPDALREQMQPYCEAFGVV
ncbi:MAG TPA: sulfotransferase, partial [Pseudomonadales bacterium]|nr:sulfotransferase [Pseudomonadales bacterium]